MKKEINKLAVAKTKETYKKIYRQYSARNVLNKDIVSLLDYFISLLKQGDQVLDVGCANGRESKYLSEHGLKVAGLDITPEFIRIAKKSCPQCLFIVGDMRQLPFSQSYFSGIWCCATFLHIPKKEAPVVLEEFSRCLKSRGFLYISVMKGNFNGLRPNLRMNWPERHFSDYQKSEFEELLNKANFRIVHKKEVSARKDRTFLHYFCQKQ